MHVLIQIKICYINSIETIYLSTKYLLYKGGGGTMLSVRYSCLKKTIARFKYVYYL